MLNWLGWYLMGRISRHKPYLLLTLYIVALNIGLLVLRGVLIGYEHIGWAVLVQFLVYALFVWMSPYKSVARRQRQDYLQHVLRVPLLISICYDMLMIVLFMVGVDLNQLLANLETIHILVAYYSVLKYSCGKSTLEK